MKRILYVLHSGTTGGTFLTNKDLMKNVEKEYDVFLLSCDYNFLKLFSYSNEELKLVKQYPRSKKWSAKDFHSSWLAYIYFNILTEFKIDLIHIRHLINHSFDLPQIAKKLNIPVVLSFHDFYFICPYYVLLNEDTRYCAGICKNNNLNCYNPLKSLNDLNSKEIIPQWRREVLKLFNYVDYFVTTSDFVKNLFLSIYPEMDSDSFKVIAHGRDFPKLNEDYFEVPSKDKPIKILCPANHLNEMKGSELIKQIKKEDEDNKLEFHFLGDSKDIDDFGISHGTFERDDFCNKVKEIKPSFVGIFSIWPETFCHTLTEAWSLGIPVIGSNIGVIKERIQNENGGWLIDIDDSKKSYNVILKIAENIKEYKKIQKYISKMKFKDTKDMAKEYLEIYKLFLE